MNLKIKRDDFISIVFFYFPFCAYTFCYSLIKMTTISTVIDVSFITNAFMIISIVLLLVKILFSKMTINSLAVYLVLVLVGFLTYYYSGRNDFLVVILFVLAASGGIDIDKFIKCSLYTQIIIMISTFFACYCGILPDWTYQDSGVIRHSCGFTYPSIVSGLFFYICMSILYLKKKYNWFTVVFMEILNICIYYMTRNMTAFAFLAVGLVAYVFVLRRDNKPHTTLWSPIFRGFITSLPIVYFLISFLLSLAYKNGNSYAIILNLFLHNRLRMAAQGITNYGIHLFGTDVQWVGNGGRGYTYSSYVSYNFVDNSYMYIMITYGIVAIIAVILLYLFALKWSLKSENLRLCYILVCILTYSLIEPRLIEIYFNPFVLSVALLLYERILKFMDDSRSGKLRRSIRPANR